MRILANVILLFILFPFVGTAAERHALVIGNDSYQMQALKNARNDAKDMAAQLQSMGYVVQSGGALLDLDRESMEQAIDRFANSLPKGASAVLYYAGHGMANETDNYLIPINSNLSSQSQLRQRTIGLRSIVDHLKFYNPDGTNVVLLDACRNNPLTRSFRGASQGLQQLNDIPRGVFIGYAAESGKIASDNHAGDNGVYTGQLLESMSANPDVSIEALHKEVADKVYETTNGEQFPVSEYQIYGTWCFGKCASDKLLLPDDDDDIPKPTETLKNNEVKSAAINWKMIGGVILGLAAIAFISGGDDVTDPQTGIRLLPPGQ